MRTCDTIMRGTYLQCETVVDRPDGRGRTYRFLINYNRNTKRFEMLSYWSNVPHKASQVMTPDDTRRRWRIVHDVVIGDREGGNDHWSELVFDSPGRITWTGRRVTRGEDPSTAPISFVETWVKR